MNSAHIREMFDQLNPRRIAISDAAHELIEKVVTNRGENPDVSAEVDAILAQEGPYLEGMNAIVFQYDSEAATRDNKQSQLYLGLLAFLLGVLALQAITVLYPALGKVQQSVTQIVLAEKALRRKTGFMELLRAVAVAANEASSVEAALQFAVDRICQHAGWPVGHVYFINPKASAELISSDIWHLEDASQFEVFRSASASTPLALDFGLPGRVAKGRKSVWIADINQDTNFPRKNAALDLGVRAGFAFPVLAQADVVAVLEFSRPVSRNLTPSSWM